MAVFNASGNVELLNDWYAYAQRVVLPRIVSTFFQRSPYLTFLTGKVKGETYLGRPGTLGLIGGAGNFDQADRQNYVGVEVHQRLQTGKVGGGKTMLQRDTMPSTGNTSQDQQVSTAVWRWWRYVQPIKVWNSTIRASKGDKYKIADAMKEATEMAMEELFDALTLQIYYGLPVDQAANMWTSPLGILSALKANNTYANVDRSTASYWNGLRVTGAKSIGLNIIDDANFTQGCANKGPGVDFGLTSAKNYQVLKQEGLSRGQKIEVMEMPAHAELGIKQECIKYGNVYITYDPFLTGNWSAFDADVTDATKLLFLFTSEDHFCDFDPSGNFNIAPYVDQSDRPGSDDAITSNIAVQMRPRIRRADRSIVYTNIS